MEQGMELSTEVNTSASHDTVVIIPNKSHSPKMFLLLKHSFRLSINEKVRALILQVIMHCKNSYLATQDYEKCSFRPEWQEKFGWLHCDVCIDVAFCYICMKAQQDKASTINESRPLSLVHC